MPSAHDVLFVRHVLAVERRCTAIQSILCGSKLFEGHWRHIFWAITAACIGNKHRAAQGKVGAGRMTVLDRGNLLDNDSVQYEGDVYLTIAYATPWHRRLGPDETTATQ